MDGKHREFYRRLAQLLDEFDVELHATDVHRPRIEVEFEQPYRSDELSSLCADDARNMAKQEGDSDANV